MASIFERQDYNKVQKKFTQEELEIFKNLKLKALENLLGAIFPIVEHAILPYQIGGGVDMYYFPNIPNGTAITTIELILPDGTGPLPNRTGTYELMAFSKYKPSSTYNEKEPFTKTEKRISTIFSTLAKNSLKMKFEPGDTCELPGRDTKDKIYLIFDEYNKNETVFEIDGRKYGILLCIEIFYSEIKYARKHGSKELLNKLQTAGCYPFSDLDREPVF